MLPQNTHFIRSMDEFAHVAALAEIRWLLEDGQRDDAFEA